MPTVLNDAVSRLTGAVKQFTIAQRTLAIIGIAGLVLGAIALSSWMNKPTMSPVFSGMSSADAAAVVDQLDSQGVSYQLADGGATVLVPADQVYRLRLSLASAGLPADNSSGYALLDNMPMTSSEFQQQTTYQRALEGEIASTVSAMDGVQSASVRLALPQDSVFVSEKSDPTASVFVKTAAGKSLTKDQVQAVVHLVSAGIEGMKPTDVAVIDSSGKVLSAVGTGATDLQASADSTEYESKVRSAVENLLDQIVGPGHSAVTLTAELDYDSKQSTSETYTAPTNLPPSASSTTSETYTGSGSGATGVLGPDNIAVPTGTDGTGSYTKTTEDVNNALNKVTEVVTAAPGTVKRQSLSVAVDAEAGAALDMTALQTMLVAAAGIDTVRGDTISVQRVPFDTTTAEEAKTALAAADKAAAQAASAAQIKQYATYGIIALAVIIFFIMMARRGKKLRRDALDVGELAMMEAQRERMALEASQLDTMPALPAAIEPVEPDVTALKRAEIAALAEEQPAEVAELLRGWIGTSRSGRR